jgi:hypothetical protein
MDFPVKVPQGWVQGLESRAQATSLGSGAPMPSLKPASQLHYPALARARPSPVKSFAAKLYMENTYKRYLYGEYP